MMHEKYLMITMEAKSRGEANDCAVRALALAAGIAYVDAHKACALMGRKPRRGMPGRGLLQAVRYVGMTVGTTLLDPRQMSGSRYTMASIGRLLAGRGSWLVFVDGHVAACVDGEILDWTAGRRHRVQACIQILKKDLQT